MLVGVGSRVSLADRLSGSPAESLAHITNPAQTQRFKNAQNHLAPLSNPHESIPRRLL